MEDPRLRSIVEKARATSSPSPTWYLATAHNADAVLAWDNYWDALFRRGLVEQTTEELVRLTIVQLVGCGFCSSERSLGAEEGLDENDVEACAMPDFSPRDQRVWAAVRYARALVMDSAGADASIYDQIFEDLRANFTNEEIVELGLLSAIVLESTKVVRSLDLI